MENVTKEGTIIHGEQIRDIETPTTGDNLNLGRHMPREDDDPEVVDGNSSDGTGSVYDSKNIAEENVPVENFLTREEFRDKKLVQAGNHIDLIVSSDNEDGLSTICEGKTDNSSEDVDQSSV
jgi:hypothetical protein